LYIGAGCHRKSPNGWTDTTKALNYLEKNFGSDSDTEKKAKGEWRCLTFDGNNFHVNERFLNCCIDYHVLPECLPPHSSHRRSILDVNCFSPLKHQYRRILQTKFEARNYGVHKDNSYLTRWDRNGAILGTSVFFLQYI
jgi:hypothetical protein